LQLSSTRKLLHSETANQKEGKPRLENKIPRKPGVFL
jgi:hypothetical protein